MTRQPNPTYQLWQTDGPTFSGFIVGKEAVDENWTVIWTGPTTFSVRGSVSGLQTNGGTIDVPYYSDNEEITFTLDSGTNVPQPGDTAVFTTSPKLGNVPMGDTEIPRPGTISLPVVGGASGTRACPSE
jgi:hypothetical protein